MKTNLLAKIKDNRDELFAALEGLSEEQITKIPVVGEWTIKDAVGHISYWEGIILDHVRQSFTEGKPRAMSPDETDDIVNPREAAKRKNWTWTRVRAEFEHVRGALIAKVQGLSESDLEFQVPNPLWNETGFYSIAEMIESDAMGHCREHTEQIRKWRLEIEG
ncbi:MAG: DinB family protein [Chloroflexi bacterium]|nr:DinB family protein [Chloroflexota bacterium]